MYFYYIMKQNNEIKGKLKMVVLLFKTAIKTCLKNKH